MAETKESMLQYMTCTFKYVTILLRRIWRGIPWMGIPWMTSLHYWQVLCIPVKIRVGIRPPLHTWQVTIGILIVVVVLRHFRCEDITESRPQVCSHHPPTGIQLDINLFQVTYIKVPSGYCVFNKMLSRYWPVMHDHRTAIWMELGTP